ncbi:hypothetical protein BS17DRAFT_699083, partial [Gyrodon lividus]
LFLTSLSQPCMAISIDLLAFYCALFERSCDTTNAFASGLHTHYTRHGFHMVNKWHDILQVEVEKQIETTLQCCHDCISASKTTNISVPNIPFAIATSLPHHMSNISLSSGACALILVQRCPACFGGGKFGRPLDEGGDNHVATDGNFHHQHCCAAGDSPKFYEPSYFLPKIQVDAIGDHIKKQRKKPVKSFWKIVHDEAIDMCESSYKVADGNKQKASMDSFNDMGLIALIFRRDISLFFANIDSPGEQQKYSISLIHHLFAFLPSEATVVVLYDIGCVGKNLSQSKVPEIVWN